MSSALRSDSAKRLFTGLHAALALLVVLPLAVARYPPLYDYYGWIFEGVVTARLLNWAPGSAVAGNFYHLIAVPVPHLADPICLAVLDLFLSPVDGGRVYAAACALGFALGFAYFARSVQQKPTVVEFLGYVWAHGYLTSKGYLGNLLSVGLALLAMGWLHRRFRTPEPVFLPRHAVLLGLGAVVVYLCHLFGWGTLVLAVGAYACHSVWRRRTRHAVLLAAALVPSLALFAWYAGLGSASNEITYYGSLADKAVSLTDPLMLFFRSDPLPASLPVFWLNLLGLCAVVALVALNRTREALPGESSPLLWAGAALVLVAVCVPIDSLHGAGRPDERLIFPGLMVLLALPAMRSARAGRALPAFCLAALVLGSHAYDYREVSRQLERIRAQTERSVGARSRVGNLSVWQGRVRGACVLQKGVTFGAPVLKWFDIVRYLEQGGDSATILDTSILRYNRAWNRPPHWQTRIVEGDSVDSRSLHRWMDDFDVIQVFGCENRLEQLRSLVDDRFTPVERGEGFVVLRRKDS